MVLDPISVITAVGAAVHTASTISLQVCRFAQDINHVGQTVSEFARDILAIERTLRSLQNALENQQRENIFDQGTHELWNSVAGSISDCHVSLKRLGEMISPLLPDKPNAPLQAVRQIKLNFRKQEIGSTAAHLSSHKNNLQLILHMVSLQAIYSTPGRVAEELEPKITELRRLLLSSEKINKEVVARGLVEPSQHYITLRHSAEKVISSATSASCNSETSSIRGPRMSEAKRRNTLDWIPENEGLAVERPESTSPVVSKNSFPDPFTCSESETSPTSLTDFSIGLNDDFMLHDSDSDETLQSELVDSHFKKGGERFDAKQYTDAHRFYKKYLENAERLPIRLRKPFQIEQVHLNLAACVCHTPNLQEAEARLVNFMQHHSTTNLNTQDEAAVDQSCVRVCQASHLLAIVQYRKKKYDAAKSWCRKAVVGRGRALGKDHIDYHSSQYLMYQIFEAEESPEESSVWLDRIPTEVIPNLVKIEDEFYVDDDTWEKALPSSQPEAPIVKPLATQEPNSSEQPILKTPSSLNTSTFEARSTGSDESDISQLSAAALSSNIESSSYPSSHDEHCKGQFKVRPAPAEPTHCDNPSKTHRNSLSKFFRRRSSGTKPRRASAPPKEDSLISDQGKCEDERVSTVADRSKLTTSMTSATTNEASRSRQRPRGERSMSLEDFLRQRAMEELETPTDKRPVWQGLF